MIKIELNKAIMKTIFIFLLLLTWATVQSQDYDTLKKSDTIYVLFKGRKFENKGVSSNYEDRTYGFNGFEEELLFFHNKYLGYEKKAAKIISDVKVVNQSFIKKNKAKIITTRFLKKNDLCTVVAEILNHRKTIYIIDYTEKKDGKIVSYEVLMNTICRGDG